jgi:acetyl-CoA acetyltransferase
MTRAVILSAVRTPIGRYGGGLAAVRPDDLAALAIAEAVARAGVPAEQATSPASLGSLRACPIPSAASPSTGSAPRASQPSSVPAMP